MRKWAAHIGGALIIAIGFLGVNSLHVTTNPMFSKQGRSCIEIKICIVFSNWCIGTDCDD